MPGSMSNADPSTVLPWSLCKAFGHSREYVVIENEYVNGESQRHKLVETSRKSWRLSKRLTPGQLQTLRSFYDARKGPHQAFYFYDPTETIPKFTKTPSGTIGRYIVRFAGAWEQTIGIGRADAEISLIQLA